MVCIQEILENMTFKINDKTNIYYNSDGLSVPRVTEILSKMIHKEQLMYWANHLGFKGERYKDALNNAAIIGTNAHKAIEIYLNDKFITKDNIPFLGFLNWMNIILDNFNKVEYVYVEHKIVCKWFGGTLDALFKIDDRIFLIDFKTSNYITYTYFLQLAAYRFMLNSEENINIDGVIVLQLDKANPGFNEYLLDFNIIEHLDFINKCEATFLSLVYSYYNIAEIEKMYNNIF